MKRRDFICLVGSGLTLGWLGPLVDAAAAEQSPFVHPFLRIADDGTVTVIAKHLEMGQGIWSGLATIVADELDADWTRVRVEGAPVDQALYRNLAFGMQTTGGSTSISNSWEQLRRAGATARAMLVAAAAERFGVAADTLVVERSVVRDASGRSATFGELASAAARRAVPDTVLLKVARDVRTAFPRLDTRAKSDGSAVFAGDLRLPGLKVCVLLRAPRFGGLVRSVDDRAARALAGVRRVVAIPQDRPRAVAVVADDTWTAIQARKTLRVAWDESAAETRSSTDLAEAFRRLSIDGPAVDGPSRGDPVDAMRRATRVVQADYALPYLAHQPMEPLIAVGAWRDGRCDIWAGIQNTTLDHAATAKILGLAADRVALHTTYAGGSFGRRATFDADWISELAHVLKATDGTWPVKLMWTREDDVGGGYYRPMNHHRIRAGIDGRGRLVAIEQTVVAQSFLFPAPLDGAAPSRMDPLVIEGWLGGRYDIAASRVRWVHPRVGVPVQMYRALSQNHQTFVKESLIDDLARIGGHDAVAYRLLHLDASRPAHARQSAVLRRCAQEAGWGRPLPRGTAIGIAVQEAQNSFVALAAEVRIVDGTVKVDRVTSVIDCGRTINPDIVRAQLEGGVAFGLSALLYGGITLDQGRVTASNFSDQPVLRINEMPRRIDVFIVESTAPPTGVGEPGSVCILPAVANAVAALTGKSIRTLPLRVCRCIRGAEGRTRDRPLRRPVV